MQKKKSRWKLPYTHTLKRNMKRRIQILSDLGYDNREISKKLGIREGFISFYELKPKPHDTSDITVIVPKGKRRLHKNEQIMNAMMIAKSGLKKKTLRGFAIVP